MTDKIYNVLFLCTTNASRSIMAEALINTLGEGRFTAYSAGTHPAGHVNPFAIEKIEVIDYPTDSLRSKSWDEFASADAPEMDFIITVCNDAAGETCPIWPGQPITAQWSIENPATIEGSDDEKREAFENCFRELMARAKLFVNLPLSILDRNAIRHELSDIDNKN